MQIVFSGNGIGCIIAPGLYLFQLRDMVINTIQDWINDRTNRDKLPLIFLLGLAAGYKEKHPVCLTLLVSVRHTGCYRSAAFHTFYLPQVLKFACLIHSECLLQPPAYRDNLTEFDRSPYSMAIVEFSGRVSCSFLGRVIFRMPSSNLADTSLEAMSSPT